MRSISGYIVNMIPYLMIVIPFYTIIRIILRKCVYRKCVNWYHETVLFLFVLFIVGLASQAIISELKIGTDGGLVINQNGYKDINLVPFKVLFDTYREVFRNQNINYFIINFLGNIIMFMPIGFCVPLLWKSSNFKVTLIGFCSSLFIEISQLFLNRCTDVDDLILNTSGAALGLLVYNLLYKKLGEGMEKFRWKNIE